MEPKAKWSEVFVATGEWSAEVGPFMLEIGRNLGRCEIWHDGHRTLVWSRTVSTPCDVADLMRLTEAELARRLTGAAETMDGRELLSEGAMPMSGQAETAMPSDIAAGLNFAPRRCEQSSCESWRTAPPPTLLWRTWPESDTETAGEFRVGDLVRARFSRRIGVVSSVSHCPNAVVTFQDHKAEKINYIAVEPYTLPPIESYADLADALDELPVGTIMAVTSARGTTLFKCDSPKTYRCRHVSDDEAYWLYATALTCLREKLLPIPASIRLLPTGSL